MKLHTNDNYKTMFGTDTSDIVLLGFRCSKSNLEKFDKKALVKIANDFKVFFDTLNLVL